MASVLPAQRPNRGEHEDDARTTAEQACGECRRRSSKCDRVVPMCDPCRKLDRRCIYERQERTPLTRRYLTKVESELARTKALLQQLMPDSENSLQVNFGAPIEEPGHASHSTEIPGSQLLNNPEPGHRRTETIVHPASPESRTQHSTPSRTDNVGRIYQLPIQQVTSHRDPQHWSPVSERRPKAPSVLSLETLTSPSNFEWDERNGNLSGEKFVDGMASLTSASHEGGYLGVASGAGLLRITETGSHETNETSGSEQYARMANRPTSSIPFVLNSLGQLEPFVDAYFSLFHPSYPIVHEATFRAQFMEVIPRPTGNAWQVLLFIVAAVGVWSAAREPTTVDLGLFEAAKARLSIDMLETGNLILVQALTLISNFMQKRDKPNSSYNYTGLARRIAMGIGLHKELPTWGASLFTTEMRRRIWYCLYIFDVGAIITFSRPLDFPDDSIDVGLPMNVHDTDFTQGAKTMPCSANETTVYTHLRAQATFHKATCQIYSKIISSPFPTASELLDMDDRLIGCWLRSLPSFFQESVPQGLRFRLCHSILQWRYRDFRILMYRPLLVDRLMARSERDAAQDDDAQVNVTIQRCLDAARESVELISTFWAQEQQSMMACWYGLYVLFQAVLIPVICLRNDPQASLAAGWREQIHQAIRVLDSMSILNPTALRCLSVLRDRCGTYLDTSDDGWDQPTEELPQTQLAHLYPLMWPTLEIAQLDGMDSVLQESTIMDFMNQLPGVE